MLIRHRARGGNLFKSENFKIISHRAELEDEFQFSLFIYLKSWMMKFPNGSACLFTSIKLSEYCRLYHIRGKSISVFRFSPSQVKQYQTSCKTKIALTIFFYFTLQSISLLQYSVWVRSVVFPLHFFLSLNKTLSVYCEESYILFTFCCCYEYCTNSYLIECPFTFQSLRLRWISASVTSYFANSTFQSCWFNVENFPCEIGCILLLRFK